MTIYVLRAFGGVLIISTGSTPVTYSTITFSRAAGMIALSRSAGTITLERI